MKHWLLLVPCFFAFSGCDKKEKEKFGVHDHPVFLQQCDHSAYIPNEDPLRSIHLEWLKKHHPKIFAYGEHHPEILSRELVLAASMSEKFQMDQDVAVVFIGATDGELPQLFAEIFGIRKITIVDLEPCLRNISKKLSGLPIQWMTPDQIHGQSETDLVISGTTFSHLSAAWQKHLFDQVFAKAKGGALFYQSTPRHWGVRSWKREKFLNHLKDRFHIEMMNRESSRFLTEDTSSFILFAR